MKYYYLRNAVATTETGSSYPQIIKFKGNYDSDASDSIYKLYENKYDFPNEVSRTKLLLENEAKLTDLLSSSMFVLFGFLINHRLKNIILKHKLPLSKLYDVDVYSENQISTYFWLHFIYKYDNNLTFEQMEEQLIDYSKSKFMVVKNLKLINFIEIASINDYHQQQNVQPKYHTIKAQELVLKKPFLKFQYDVFKFTVLSNDWIISEKLMHELLNSKITGLDFEEIKEIKIQ